MKRFILLSSLMFGLTFSITAQSSEKITEILNTEQVTLGQVAYMAGTCGRNLPEDTSYDDSFKKLMSSSKYTSTDKATLLDVADIFVKSTNMECGIMYKITRAKRYAFKELKAKGSIPENADPSLKVSGHDLIAILNECLGE